MKINPLPDHSTHTNTVIALGNFDGLHYGHLALMEELKEMKKELNLPSAVLMFTTHTSEITEHKKQSLLQSNRQKEQTLTNLGIDIIYEVPFTKELMTMEPEDFISKFLIGNLKVKGIVVGYNYHFGYKARGNTDLLVELQKDYGYKLKVVDPIRLEGKEVSSTRIRGLIQEGRIREANRLLTRPFTIEGEIIHGKQLGRTIGIPTANMRFNTHYVHPRFGVYLGRFHVNGTSYYTATNIGTNPTFHEQGIKVESFLLHFSGDLYGSWAELELLEFLRPELTFETVEQLQSQMQKDIQRVEELVKELQ